MVLSQPLGVTFCFRQSYLIVPAYCLSRSSAIRSANRVRLFAESFILEKSLVPHSVILLPVSFRQYFLHKSSVPTVPKPYRVPFVGFSKSFALLLSLRNVSDSGFP